MITILVQEPIGHQITHGQYGLLYWIKKMSYSETEYLNKLFEANNKGEKLYVINNELVIAPIDYYICFPNSNVSDGTLNPRYKEVLKERFKQQCDEVKRRRQAEYKRKSDPLILRKLRKQLLSQWNNSEEEKLISQLQNISTEIKKAYPYPTQD